MKALTGGSALKKLDITVSVTFRRVYVRFSLPVDEEAHPELYEALGFGLSTLNGVNALDLLRYEAVLDVALHVRTPRDVAFDVFEVVFEPDGDVVSAILKDFDSYELTEKID